MISCLRFKNIFDSFFLHLHILLLTLKSVHKVSNALAKDVNFSTNETVEPNEIWNKLKRHYRYLSMQMSQNCLNIAVKKVKYGHPNGLIRKKWNDFIEAKVNSKGATRLFSSSLLNFLCDSQLLSLTRFIFWLDCRSVSGRDTWHVYHSLFPLLRFPFVLFMTIKI